MTESDDCSTEPRGAQQDSNTREALTPNGSHSTAERSGRHTQAPTIRRVSVIRFPPSTGEGQRAYKTPTSSIRVRGAA